MPKKIRILIVDDSALFRAMVSRGVAEDPEIEIVAQAGDPFEAREKIIQFDPDVMVCDVVMPKMDGAPVSSKSCRRKLTQRQGSRCHERWSSRFCGKAGYECRQNTRGLYGRDDI